MTVDTPSIPWSIDPSTTPSTLQSLLFSDQYTHSGTLPWVFHCSAAPCSIGVKQKICRRGSARYIACCISKEICGVHSTLRRSRDIGRVAVVPGLELADRDRLGASLRAEWHIRQHRSIHFSSRYCRHAGQRVFDAHMRDGS